MGKTKRHNNWERDENRRRDAESASDAPDFEFGLEAPVGKASPRESEDDEEQDSPTDHGFGKRRLGSQSWGEEDEGRERWRSRHGEPRKPGRRGRREDNDSTGFDGKRSRRA